MESKVFIKINKAEYLKTTLITISELLAEGTINFDSDDQEEACASFKAIDSTRNTLVVFKISKKEIEKSGGIYMCSKPFSVGINVTEIVRHIKRIESKNTLSFRIGSGTPDFITIKSESNGGFITALYNIKLLDLDEYKIDINGDEYKHMVSIRSQEFHNICNKLQPIGSPLINIKLRGNSIEFSSIGDLSTGTIILKETSKESENQGEIYSNDFQAKLLSSYAKAHKISQTVLLMMAQDFLLKLLFTIEGVGVLIFYSSPYIKEPKKTISNEPSEINLNFANEETNSETPPPKQVVETFKRKKEKNKNSQELKKPKFTYKKQFNKDNEL